MLTLKSVMRLNAKSCLIFGLMFVLIPGQVTGFLAQENQAPPLVFIVLGIALFANAAHLVWAATKKVPGGLLVLYFSIGDFFWVLLTILLILTGWWITTPGGIAVSLVVAIMVGTFGFLQITKRSG